MKRRSLILIVLIVLLPVALLTWLGARMARDEQSFTQQRFRSVMQQRLEDVNRGVATKFQETERRLHQITTVDDFDLAGLREIVRSEPQVTQMFVLSPDGTLVYPNPAGQLNVTELSFLQRAARMFTDRDLQNAVTRSRKAVPLATDPGPALTKAETREEPNSFLPSNGWFVWYWDRGLNLIYWQRRPNGHIVGAALERARWIADLIAWLPETDASPSDRDSAVVQTSFRVVSSAAELVYEWGSDLAEEETPFCETSLAPPLASWRLQCFIPAEQVALGGGQRAFLGFAIGLGGFVITLTSLAWLLYRDYARDMREASHQVSFVNQVSHELKTPLTNIRLYADLLEHDLEQMSSEYSEKPLKRLGIITSEAQRLSRLIGNVLTFAKQHRKTLQLHPVPVNVSDVVRQIADRFAPSLNNHGIQVCVTGEAVNKLWLDPDFVEQILGNLISNVEKYAASGGKLTVRMETTQNDAVIDVIDAGPGITWTQRAGLFQPFSRLSNDLRASTGTGIGLSITRELARLHGGDVTLMDSDQGCWFRVSLKSQVAIPGNSGGFTES